MLGESRKRRTQSGSLLPPSPIEIVVTASSPTSSSFPVSPVRHLSLSRLLPPPSHDYRIVENYHDGTAQGYDRPLANPCANFGGPRSWIVMILAGIATFSVLQQWNERARADRANELVVEEMAETRLNLARRDVAAKLFHNVTFHPAPASFQSTEPSRRPPRLDPSATYLFPVRIAEQESKAQQHLHQLSLLAISLNRTLILPNVGGSRLHACQPFPFAFHYDIDGWRQRYRGKLAVVEQEEWFQGIEESGKRYRASTLRLTEGKKTQSGQLEGEGRTVLDLSRFCLERYSPYFDLVDSSVSTLFAPLHYREFDDVSLAGFSNRLVSSLGRTHPSESADENYGRRPVELLIVDYDLRYPVFPERIPNSTDLTPTRTELEAESDDPSDDDPETLSALEIASFDPFPALKRLDSPVLERHHPFLPFFPLPYTDYWEAIAADIATLLVPYVGVHWRMETVSTSHLPSCANALAKTLTSLTTSTTGSDSTLLPNKIYLSSDYPLDSLLLSNNPSALTSPPSLSDTFVHLTASHRAAASRLVSLLQSRPSPLWHWLGFRPAPSRSVETLATVLRTNPTVLPASLVALLGPFDFDLFRLDSGLRAILDKLVLERADRFVAGWSGKDRGMCAKGSSFTESILSKRRKNLRGPDRETEQLDGGIRDGQGQVATEEDERVVRWFRRPT
ncbi:hypothetical protein JCM10212_004719 [Sporobolomyces blumeae]